jgi:hypothetical protein
LNFKGHNSMETGEREREREQRERTSSEENKEAPLQY